MAHDASCENADTPPSNCDCSCGGDKHGTGYIEDQIHRLESDFAEFNSMKASTPDAYEENSFGNSDIHGVMIQAMQEIDKQLHNKDPEKLEKWLDDEINVIKDTYEDREKIEKFVKKRREEYRKKIEQTKKDISRLKRDKERLENIAAVRGKKWVREPYPDQDDLSSHSNRANFHLEEKEETDD